MITSERATKISPSWTLDDLLAAALADIGTSRRELEEAGAANPRIWDAFRECWSGAQLVSGATRDLPALLEPSLVRQVTLPINEALASPAALREAVRGLIEADLAVFDVTGRGDARSPCRRTVHR